VPEELEKCGLEKCATEAADEPQTITPWLCTQSTRAAVSRDLSSATARDGLRAEITREATRERDTVLQA
jgi:hypothetical protein